MMKETVGSDIERQGSVLLNEVEIVDATDGTFCLATDRAETAEVMLTDQRTCGVAHRRHIQRLVHPNSAASLKRRPGPANQDAVRIVSSDRAETGVKPLIDRMSPTDRDVWREIDITAENPGALASDRRGVEVHHLFVCMNARIGATGALDADGMIGDPTHREF